MHAEDVVHTGFSLVPQMVLVAAPPDAVYVALQRYAFNPANAKLPREVFTRYPMGKWAAQPLETGPGIVLTLQDGPLRSFVLRFSVQSDEMGASMLWITGVYEPRRSLLRGPLDRWQAQRDAIAMRDGVLVALRSMVEQQGQQNAGVRRYPRKRVRAHARLWLASHGWRGEVLDVSEGGLALVVICAPAHAEATAAFMLQEQVGEVELVLPGLNDRIQVVVRRAQPSRGGVQVGLQVIEPEKILPLVRKALAEGEDDAEA